MNKPNTPPTVRDALARLSGALARLAQLAAEIVEHVPDGDAKPKPDSPGRPPKYKTEQERVAARRKSARDCMRRRRAMRCVEPPRFSSLRTPATMPKQPLRVGACRAAGLNHEAIALALDLNRNTVDQALYRFRRFAALTSSDVEQVRDWFAAMRVDPTAHRPHEARLSWAETSAARAAIAVKRRRSS